MLARSYEYGRQKVADDYVDDEFSYQEYDFQGAAGFSFGGVKAEVIDCEDSFCFSSQQPCSLMLVHVYILQEKLADIFFFNTWNKPIAKNK